MSVDTLTPRYEQGEHGEYWLTPEHRQNAELLAATTLGALGVAMFEQEPEALRPAVAPAVEVQPVVVEAAPETMPISPQRLQGMAAIYFAEHSLN